MYHGPCHCENCKRLFKEQYGLDIPDRDDPRSPDYRKYAAFKSACTKAQRERLVQTVRSISPELAINNVDYIRTESATEIGVPQWQYSASCNARRTAGPLRLRPADNASVDFMGFRYRDSSVSAGQLALRQWQNLANAGSVSLYIMGHLDNHKDRTALNASKAAFAFHREHEALYRGLQSAAKVLLVTKPIMARSDPEVYGWVRALTESHIPFDEVKLTELTPELLRRWDVVILGDVKQCSPQQTTMLDAYAAQGRHCAGKQGAPRRCNALAWSVYRQSSPTVCPPYLSLAQPSPPYFPAVPMPIMLFPVPVFPRFNLRPTQNYAAHDFGAFISVRRSYAITPPLPMFPVWRHPLRQGQGYLYSLVGRQLLLQ